MDRSITGDDAPSGPQRVGEVHLCDNYAHLLVASADLAARAADPDAPVRQLLFIDDHLSLSRELAAALPALTAATLRCVSDRGAIEEFARFPAWVPGMVRRNVTWSGWRPCGPSAWRPSWLGDARFRVAYVYHPGFFLSKVLSGSSETAVMRDSGYANYVTHRVPWGRRPLRLLAGRNPRAQVWGEEPWIDSIEVARPDLLPSSVRHKATPLTTDELLARLEPSVLSALTAAFWGTAPPISLDDQPTALLVTQPIDQLGMCSTAAKEELYGRIIAVLRHEGYTVVVKPHPRERHVVGPSLSHVPASFPIEAWSWMGHRPFDAAVSLNSAALAGRDLTFTRQRLQLVPRERFYPQHWTEWPMHIERALGSWINGSGALTRNGDRRP